MILKKKNKIIFYHQTLANFRKMVLRKGWFLYGWKM